jgi:hypothetical protein
MRRLTILFMGSTAAFASLVGCSSQQEVTSDSTPVKEEVAAKVQQIAAPGKQGKEVFVFRAKYYRTTGPCIQMGDKLVMPTVDGFEVVEVIKGKLTAKTVEVRPHTGGGSAYPGELKKGKVYTLKLTPSESTRQQLRENETKGYSYVWIDGDELEEQKVGK